ncbi:hypothetical protein NEAUS06_2521 [Nematocida ausubeli]|nr:hypothetical protein NEAUS06_2521 [Nematocida ausubeli]
MPGLMAGFQDLLRGNITYGGLSEFMAGLQDLFHLVRTYGGMTGIITREHNLWRAKQDLWREIHNLWRAVKTYGGKFIIYSIPSPNDKTFYTSPKNRQNFLHFFRK